MSDERGEGFFDADSVSGGQVRGAPPPQPSARGGGVSGPQGRLVRKYAVLFALVVSGALLLSGLVQGYFAFEEGRAGLNRVQRVEARAAAGRIAQFVDEVDRQVRSVAQVPRPAGGEQRRADYLRLLRQAPAIAEIAHVDATGTEQIRVSLTRATAVGGGTDYSNNPAFLEPRSTGRTYFGPVYFRADSEPFMTIAARESGPDPGVTVAEVNLKLIWDVVSRIRIGQAGYAYVVDAGGQLLAHPDLSLVLRRTDMSGLPQVQAALGTRGAGRGDTGSAQDLAGRSVLSAQEAVPPTGWLVFVEQPLDEALAPLIDVIERTALLVLLGIVLSVVVSLVLARRMVTPIRALQVGAARIGGGALDQRIDVRTGDELEALAAEFNRMAAQLQESYAGLEEKVEERTHELARALEENTRLIEEIQQKNRELEIASQHKSEFLANMSHELRTPLNAIIGFSEVLADRMLGDLNEQQEDFLRDILDSGRHLLSLINDILDLSKVEAGQMELEPAEFSLAEALHNGLTMVRERASNHGITLALDIDPGLDEIEGDERKIKQVVFNLLSNAVKFTPDGGRVEMTAHQVDGQVRIAVRDTGIGIAPEDQARIFEEFQQARTSPEGPKVEGTGLGLALAKRFVELHGGRIWVESQLGSGSTFTFSIPVRQSQGAVVEASPWARPPTPPAPAVVSGPLALLVEDDPHSISLLSFYLAEAGLRVVEAHDGAQGLELASSLHPALIVLDVLLPEVDGWELLTRLKSDPSLASIPVIVTTVVDQRGKGLALGAVDYLVKPVRREELLAAVERSLALGSPHGGNGRVLAIDDEPMAIELVRTVLTAAGYEVLAAAGGAEGVAIAQRELPQLIVLDLIMPEVDGFEVVERLRGDPATAAIPILILTSKITSREDRERLNGRVSFLAQKADFNRAEFVVMVQQLCQPAVA